MQKATNLTVLGVASLATTIPVVGGVLILLFVFMKPEATAGYLFHERLVFWTVHIGLGLAGVFVASHLLRSRPVAVLPVWASVLITGIAGAALLAPVYLYLESFVPVDLAAEPDDWLDRLAEGGLLYSMVAEWIEVIPVFLAAWFTVNLPLILGKPELNDAPEDDPPDSKDDGRTALTAEHPASNQRLDSGMLDRVPHALGKDIVLISSDMHYLHIHTTRGKCMVLGTLRGAADELGERGMLVHRSHWVAHEHVKKLARRGSSWSCVMSNDVRVPVSRRKRKEVTDWYGHSANVVTLAAGKQRTDSAGTN